MFLHITVVLVRSLEKGAPVDLMQKAFVAPNDSIGAILVKMAEDGLFHEDMQVNSVRRYVHVD